MPRICSQPAMFAALALFAAIFPFPVFANSLVWVAIPASVLVLWISVVPIVFEWAVFRWWFSLSWKVATLSVFVSNLASSVVGFFIGIAFVALMEPLGAEETLLKLGGYAIVVLYVGFVFVTASVNAGIETPVLKRLGRINVQTGRMLWVVFSVNAISCALLIVIVIGYNAISDAMRVYPEADLEESLAEEYHDELAFLDTIFSDLWNKEHVNGIDAALISNWAEKASRLHFREIKIVVWKPGKAGAYHPRDETIVVRSWFPFTLTSYSILGTNEHYFFDYSVGRVICCRRVIHLSRTGVFEDSGLGTKLPFEVKAVVDWP